MPENILKGVYKEGPRVASVLQRDDSARIMLKGAEPGADGFLEAVRRAVEACRTHVASFAERDLCLVLVENPAAAESVPLGRPEIEAMGLTRVSLMDGHCGIVVRVIEAEPPPVPLPYGSLRSDHGLPDQPGIVDIPSGLPRRTYKDLTEPQRKVFEAAAQIAGRGLVRLVCFEDGDLRMAVTVKDAPPPRARSVLVPLGTFAEDLARGVALEEIARRLAPLRT